MHWLNTAMSEKPEEAVRYGVVGAEHPMERALDFVPYTTEQDAHDVRKYLDKHFPDLGKHRVVKATITLEEVQP